MRTLSVAVEYRVIGRLEGRIVRRSMPGVTLGAALLVRKRSAQRARIAQAQRLFSVFLQSLVEETFSARIELGSDREPDAFKVQFAESGDPREL
jgi:hypothetical protein